MCEERSKLKIIVLITLAMVAEEVIVLLPIASAFSGKGFISMWGAMNEKKVLNAIVGLGGGLGWGLIVGLLVEPNSAWHTGHPFASLEGRPYPLFGGIGLLHHCGYLDQIGCLVISLPFPH